jgi:hypothetical protein
VTPSGGVEPDVMPYDATTGTGVPSVTSCSTAFPEPCWCVRRSGQSSTM